MARFGAQIGERHVSLSLYIQLFPTHDRHRVMSMGPAFWAGLKHDPNVIAPIESQF